MHLHFSGNKPPPLFYFITVLYSKMCISYRKNKKFISQLRKKKNL